MSSKLKKLEEAKTPEASQKIKKAEEAKKRSPKIMQTNMPSYSIEDALAIPRAIWDNFAGRPCAPLQVCTALELSPASSKFRDLAGASIAYGFTTGGWNAKTITLEQIGKRAVAPTEEGDDLVALKSAALKPSILKRFFEYYDGKKFPKEVIAENMLVDWGVPKERASKILALIKENGYFCGMLIDIKGNQYISIDGRNSAEGSYENTEHDPSESVANELPQGLIDKLDILPKETSPAQVVKRSTSNNKVFISHGKNRAMVDNLKELLTFGSFEPVVSLERETTAIPVPEKVFSDMRECCAGIIHIEEERALIDSEGAQHKMLNENVLIEIGAAIALYGNRIILLCQKGITLPSNLQGLYRCDYEGDKLDYDATMKLLKTFNEFKSAD